MSSAILRRLEEVLRPMEEDNIRVREQGLEELRSHNSTERVRPMDEDNLRMREQGLEELRSRSSTERAYLRFVNLTTCSVEVVWINYSGQYVKYQLLERGNFVDVNTYKTHPWIALDTKTKDRLLIDGCHVYMPKNLNVPENRRIVVNITLPLYSLRFRTLLEVRSFFKKPEDCEPLELPTAVKDDLKKAIEQRNKTVVTPILRIQ